MSALVVDTSVWIDYFRGQQYPVIDEALAEARVYVPPLVCAELLSGRMLASRRRQLVEFLNDLPLCDSRFEHWCAVGQLREKLSRKGLAVSTPDAHIAQCALDLSGELLTRDRVFHHISRWMPLRHA